MLAGLQMSSFPFTAHSAEAVEKQDVPQVAAIVTSYYHNSHADVLVSRMFQGHMLNGTGRFPKLKLASLYTDQIQTEPAYKDVSRAMVAKYMLPLYDNISDALTLKTGKLAVDGVLLIAEHGSYPLSDRGQIVYPKRRMFDEIVKVFKKSERVVPVFLDKHLADNWEDAKYIYDTAREMKIPLMAGSSVPLSWRYPAVDVPRDAELKEILITSYGPIEGYTFHALEAVQALAERRQGGETGVASVQCFEDEAVWNAGKRGLYDPELLQAALDRLKTHPLPPDTDLQKRIKKPVLIHIRYRDGLKANVLILDYPVTEWAAAWRQENDKVQSTVYWTQEMRPLMHFGYFLDAIEQHIHTGKPTWPVERTLITTGILSAIFDSLESGKVVKTPHLKIAYESDWNFKQPPPPPPGRDLKGD